MNLNYFICTLGQASRLEAQHKTTPFTNINDFVERQAQKYGNLPAVGFYNLSKDSSEPWQTQVLTFEEVLQGVCVFAEKLSQNIEVSEKQTVALLCPSSANFLFTWLGLMRLGHPVLLIAPQCSSNAIVELCKQCDCSTLLYDDLYSDLAKSATESGHKINLRPLPFADNEIPTAISKPIQPPPKADDISPHDVAYLHHTSGTSSGIPKPIPQTHNSGAGVYFPFDGSCQATFTTTPLYHGGIADLSRAWTSHALVWLFPGKEAPITAGNVVKCLEAAENAETGKAEVEFLSCVPYVLEMLREDEKGIEWLRRMSLVGVGGAALPKSVGDGLVEQGVNLVSRFGSAECGFLLSSSREFGKDKEWQYLRNDEQEDKLRFEEREDGLAELVILDGWPHMSKRNREDGSFATSDSFQPHPTIKGAWRYHSRADSQLTLVTGKKFDPSPLEAAITSSTSVLGDVLLFGNGKPYPGALLFRSLEAKDLPNNELIDMVGPKVEELNKESQSHARIAKSVLIPMQWSEQPLEKSSKGTILRGKAEERYASEIEAAYEQASSSNAEVQDDQVPEKLLDIVSSVMNTKSSETLDSETDLFAYGVDSIACVRIRQAASQLLLKESKPLPITIVQDCGTVSKLSQVILDLRKGRQPTIEKEESIDDTMLSLVSQYRSFLQPINLTPPRSPTSKGNKSILLTGPTGSLGSHLLSQLSTQPEVQLIHVLVRGASPYAARERVVKALTFRKLSIPWTFEDKVVIHPCALSKPHLGLSKLVYDRLAKEVDVVYHLAWSVDFTLPLRGFKQHFTGLQSLLSLRPAQFVFCSSTAALSAASHPEKILTDPETCTGGIGYSRSKWVAENILLAAHEQFPEMRIDVVRAGQLSGDSVHGVWNMSEAIPLLLSAAKEVKALPDLEGLEEIRWVPIDVAAKSFIELLGGRKNNDRISVFHLVNPHTTGWRDLCEWLRASSGGEDVEAVPVREWLVALKKSKADGRDHPALKLLEFWKEAYGTERKPVRGEYEMKKTFEAMPAVKEMEPVGRDYVSKLWDWIQKASF